MEINECCKMLKAIADDTRLFILKSLIKTDELCACKLLEIVNCNQSTLSHHMKILVDSCLIHSRNDWKWTYYSCNKAKLDQLCSYLMEE